MSTRNLLARTPPMGWNSFDNFCCAITEKQVRQQADAMVKLLAPYGWKYLVIDAGWYGVPGTPVGETMDEYGRYWPSPEWFPSAANGAGLKPLADYVHGLGLRFGLHIMRGIPRTAVEKNLPILGSSQRSADFWDRWIDIKRQFNQCHLWSPFIGNGFWPDADMLPLGRIGGGHEGLRRGTAPNMRRS